MNLYWHETSQQSREFTSKLLKWWFAKHGGAVVGTAAEADMVAVSICSPRDTSVLSSARKVADAARKPVLLGGPECYTGAPYLAWADHICIGEGYGLLADLARHGASALDRGNVLHRSDPLAEVIPDYAIPWGRLPMIQTAAKAFYYLAGRGCHRKCAFCFTSWTQPHASVPDRVFTAATSGLPKGSHAVYVTNDDGGMAAMSGSTTLRQFLDPSPRKWPMVIRLGIEGVTEARRKAFGKPMTDEDIVSALLKASSLGRQLELFYIVGWPDDPPPEEAFAYIANAIGAETVRSPRVYMKFTWFEAAPHTPLGHYDIGALREWDYYAAIELLRAHSGRFRLFKAGNPATAIWCAVLRRLGPDQAMRWYTARSEVEATRTFAGAAAIAVQMFGQEYVNGKGVYPWEKIKTRVR